MKTAPLARVSATPLAPNRMASVWAALTTTLTTMSAAFRRLRRRFGAVAAVGHEPRHGIRRDVAAGDLEPARRSEVAMPNPIEPSPMTAMRGFADFGHAAIPRWFLVVLASG